MNDCKFIELDDSLPKLIKEVLDYQIDWESDEEVVSCSTCDGAGWTDLPNNAELIIKIVRGI